MKNASRSKALCVLAVLASSGVASAAGWAQSPPVVVGSTTIDSGALAGATGLVAVNEAAGVNNAQSNQAVVAAGANGLAVAGGAQSALAGARVPSASAAIEGNAFSGASGALMVNQAAGAANLQRNSAVLGTAATGMEIVSDIELSVAIPKAGQMDQSATAHGAREVSIDNGAFKNINGIAQINQTAGAGNTTANSFVLRPPAGTFF